MDGENNGKPYVQMDDLGGVFPRFSETSIYGRFTCFQVSHPRWCHLQVGATTMDDEPPAPPPRNPTRAPQITRVFPTHLRFFLEDSGLVGNTTCISHVSCWPWKSWSCDWLGGGILVDEFFFGFGSITFPKWSVGSWGSCVRWTTTPVEVGSKDHIIYRFCEHPRWFISKASTVWYWYFCDERRKIVTKNPFRWEPIKGSSSSQSCRWCRRGYW